MKRLLLLVGFALAAPATANDARLATRTYKADDVVRIEGRVGVQASIAFADDEHIENVAIGDSASWQVTPNKRANMLFVKPLGPRARTNMTVVTDRHAYYFDLAANPRAAPLYALRFSYPPEPVRTAAVRPPGPPGLTEEEARAVGGAPAERPSDPATLNFAWRARGKSALLPARIFDDGASTYLAWTPGRPMPAILTRNDKGEEGPVNFAVRGDTIVVIGVPSPIVLRAGRDMATLENQGPPRGEPPAQALASSAKSPPPEAK